MVAEITFEAAVGPDRHVWRALVELETNSILYLRPLSAYVNGYVYEEDPITKTGTPTPTSASNNATLNPHRDDVLLQNVHALGATLTRELASMPGVTEVRGRGLLLGAVTTTPAADVVAEARRRGLLVLTAGDDVVRLAPPLTIGKADVSAALDILRDCISC